MAFKFLKEKGAKIFATIVAGIVIFFASWIAGEYGSLSFEKTMGVIQWAVGFPVTLGGFIWLGLSSGGKNDDDGAGN